MNPKKIIPPLIGLAVLCGGVGYGVYWYLDGRFHETTDNAYLHADTVSVEPKVSGYVDRLLVKENQAVKKGDLMVVIDDSDYQEKLDQAKAAYESRVAALNTMDKQIDLQKSAIAQAQANVDVVRAEVKRTGDDYKRYKNLSTKGFASQQKFDYAKADRQKASANLAAAQATLQVETGRLEVLKAQRVEAERAVNEAQANQALAQQSVDDTRLKAPFDGVIGNRSVEQGKLVQPGQQLFVLVPLPKVYAVANFKETQLEHMAPGQKVKVEVDAFPDADVTGTVDSFAPATGAQFSLLPPENATGNFTKITQRVPVRINLDQSPVTDALRPGMSVVVDVDVRDASGTMHASAKGLAQNVQPAAEVSERD